MEEEISAPEWDHVSSQIPGVNNLQVCGFVDFGVPTAPPKSPAPIPPELLAEFPELGDFVNPPRDSAAIVQSVLAHQDRRVYSPAPGGADAETATKKLLGAYSWRCPYDCDWILSESSLRQKFLFAVDHLNPTAFPGYPWCKLGETNKAVVENSLELAWQMFLIRIRICILLGQAVASGRPVDAGILDLMRRAADIVRLMIKGEFHPLRKKITGRWRLISMVSIIDQLIDRVLHNNLNKLEIASHRTIPSQPGIGFDDPELRYLSNAVFGISDRSDLDISSYDVAGWDWTIQPHEHNWEMNLRWRLCDFTGTQQAQSLVAAAWYGRALAIAAPAFMLPGNRCRAPVFILENPGIQLSGLFNTSSSNSHIRVYAAFLAGAKWALANGDDCLEGYLDGYDPAVAYDKQGRKLRPGGKSRNKFEFCSHNYERGKMGYICTAKFICNALNAEKDEENCEQFRHLLRHHPKRDLIIQAVLNPPKELSNAPPFPIARQTGGF